MTRPRWSIATLDVNCDGVGDLIVGAYRANVFTGEAHVFSGGDRPRCRLLRSRGAELDGGVAAIDASGSRKLAANALTLYAASMPQDQLGCFLNSRARDFVPHPPGSQGNLCLGGAIGRHVAQVQSSGATGAFAIQVDLSALPVPGGTHVVSAGETRRFQCWFRDTNPGPTSNFTDGISIVLQ